MPAREQQCRAAGLDRDGFQQRQRAGRVAGREPGGTEQYPGSDLGRFQHVVRLDDGQYRPRVRLGGGRVAPVQLHEPAYRARHPDQQRMPGLLAVPERVGQQVVRVLQRGQPTRDDPAHHEGQSAPPVVGRGGEVAVCPTGTPVGLFQLAQFRVGEGLDRAQGTHRPPLADPLAERQEEPGQPARLGQPAGEQPGERRGTPQPRAPERIGLFGEEPRGPAQRGIGAGEVAAGRGDPREVLQRPRQVAPVAGGHGQLVRIGEPGVGLGQPAAQVVGHAEPAQRLTLYPGDAGRLGRHERFQPGVVGTLDVAHEPVRPAGDEQRTGPAGGVVRRVRDDLLCLPQRLGRAPQLHQCPRVYQLVRQRQRIPGQGSGPLRLLYRLRRLARAERPPRRPAERGHPERRHRPRLGLGTQPDRVGQYRGPLDVFGHERVRGFG